MQMAPNGRMFFIDHNERKTSWVDPRTGRASPMPNQARKPEDDLGPLPEGWEERVHSDGRIFFIDHSKWKNNNIMDTFEFRLFFFRHKNHTMGRSSIVKSKYSGPGSTLFSRL